MSSHFFKFKKVFFIGFDQFSKQPHIRDRGNGAFPMKTEKISGPDKKKRKKPLTKQSG
jgi:hypothetical protein